MVIKKVRHKYLAKVWLFSGVQVSGMVDHVTLTLQGDNPDNILYTGTSKWENAQSNFKIYRISDGPTIWWK